MADALIQVLESHAAAGGASGERAWVGGYSGRAASALKIRELLLATGLGGGTSRSTSSDASEQVNLNDEAQGSKGWAEPVPHSWVPWISQTVPLPAGILTVKKLRALIWAIYVDRMDSEPTLSRIGTEGPTAAAAPNGGQSGTAPGPRPRSSKSRQHQQQQPPRTPMPPLVSSGEGGATDVLADGEVVTKQRLAPRNSFADFVTDWLQHSYSTKPLAIAQLNALVAALRKHTATDDVRLRTFERLCGASQQPPIGPESLSFLLRVMHLSLTLKPGSCAHFAIDSAYLLSLERTHAVVHALFGKAEGGSNQPKVEERVRDKLVQIAAAKGGGR